MEAVTLPEQVVIGILCEGTWQDLPRLVPEAWGRLFSEVSASESFVEVSISFSGGVYTELVGYLAGRDAPVPSGMTRLVIPSRSYLHAVHDGPLNQTASSFLALENEARRIGRHSDFKLDIGYPPGLPDSPHDLYVGLEPEQETAG